MSYRPGHIPEPPQDNKWGRELTSRLRVELLAISKTIPESIVTTAWGRAGEQAVGTAGSTISFSPALIKYNVFAYCLNAAGESVGYVISAKGTSSFLVTPTEDSTFTWVAVPRGL